MNLPLTVLECHAEIRKLHHMWSVLKVEKDNRGVASELLREPNNFKLIDSVLETVKNCPFKMTEIFDSWLKLTKLDVESKKVITDLRQHFHGLLTHNNYIKTTGGKGRGALWRVSENYSYILRECNSLNWRKAGQVEGTYLTPETS